MTFVGPLPSDMNPFLDGIVQHTTGPNILPQNLFAFFSQLCFLLFSSLVQILHGGERSTFGTYPNMKGVTLVHPL